MNRKSLSALVLIAALILSACATPTPAGTTEAPAATTEAPQATSAPATTAPEATTAPSIPEPKDKETFIHMTFGDPETLDPHFDYESAGSNVLQNIYEGLITFDGPDPLKFRPQLAESIPDPAPTDEGGVSYTWTILDGVKFHNGADLTAEDVAYSFWRSMLQSDPNAPGFLLLEAFLDIDDATQLVDPEGNLVGDPESLKQADSATLVAACEQVKATVTFDDASRTVTMNLIHPWGPFLATLAGGPWATVIDKDWAIENTDWDGDCATWQNFYGIPSESGIIRDKTNGTGPYMLDHWTPNDELVLVSNPNYRKGEAALKRIVITNVTEFGTRFAALQAGDADFAVLGSKADEVQMDTLVRDDCDAQTGECETTNPNGILRAYRRLVPTARTNAFFTFNIAEGSSLVGSGALDGEGIPADFFSDIHVRKAFNYCFDWEAYISDVLLGDGVQAEALTLPGQPGYDGTPHYTTDFAKCEEEFRASTLTAEDGRPLWDVGFYFQIGYNAGNTARQSIAEIISAGLQQVNPNFFVAPVAMPWPTFLRLQRSLQLPIFISGWGEDIHDPHNWYQPHLTGTYAQRQNLPEELQNRYRDLINAGVLQTDLAQRAEIYTQLNQLVYEDAPEIILAFANFTYYEPLYLQGWLGGQNQNTLVNSSGGNFYYYELSKE
jgi:peptide/nickel transport system substrate-binding protein